MIRLNRGLITNTLTNYRAKVHNVCNCVAWLSQVIMLYDIYLIKHYHLLFKKNNFFITRQNLHTSTTRHYYPNCIHTPSPNHYYYHKPTATTPTPLLPHPYSYVATPSSLLPNYIRHTLLLPKPYTHHHPNITTHATHAPRYARLPQPLMHNTTPLTDTTRFTTWSHLYPHHHHCNDKLVTSYILPTTTTKTMSPSPPTASPPKAKCQQQAMLSCIAPQLKPSLLPFKPWPSLKSPLLTNHNKHHYHDYSTTTTAIMPTIITPQDTTTTTSILRDAIITAILPQPGCLLDKFGNTISTFANHATTTEGDNHHYGTTVVHQIGHCNHHMPRCNHQRHNTK